MDDAPIYCYKYLPFNEGSLSVISDGTIKFTSVIEFNDPFDCRPFVSPQSIENLPSTRPDLFKAAADRRGYSPARRLREKGKMLANLKRKIKTGEFDRERFASFGICCLSRVALDILMWSHYADFHRGFIVEFRIPMRGFMSDASQPMKLLIPQSVKYQVDRPMIDFGINSTVEYLDAALLTKSDHWAYEREERVIGHGSPPGIYPYDRSRLLESVVAGMRMSESHREQLSDAVATAQRDCDKSIGFYQAKEIVDKFALFVPDHPRLADEVAQSSE